MLLVRNTPPSVDGLEKFAGRHLVSSVDLQGWRQCSGGQTPTDVIHDLMAALVVDRVVVAELSRDVMRNE